MNEKFQIPRSILEFLKDFSERAGMKKMLILDVGCGEGGKIDFFLKNNFKVIAIDKSREAVKKASNRLCRENVKFIIGDMSNIEFKPESFDLIISLAALNSLTKSNAKMVILRMKDWTKAGGYNVVSVFRGDDNWQNGNQIYLFSKGELEESYSDWRVERHQEFSFNDAKHGKPHIHHVSDIVARKAFKN